MIVIVTVVILLIYAGRLRLSEPDAGREPGCAARGDQVQAEAVGLSGREYLAAVLESPRSERPSGVEQDDAAETFGGILVDGDPDARDLEERQGRFAVLAPARRRWLTRTWRFGYENESAKLHLAMLLQWDRQQPGAGRNATDESGRHG